jgi:predicted dehydrogenase
VRQVVQDLRTGEVRLLETDAPASRAGFARVRTVASVVSPGTERALLELARRSLVGKARARPDLVRRVWAKMRRDGLAAAVRAVRTRLDAPMPLGYAAAGVVLEAPGGTGLVAGDRVACAGAGWACHAEELVVPRNLVVRVPDDVATEDAAFATLGAIALNALRAAGTGLGERVAVVGCGLLGTLVVRLARAAGLRVLAVDPDPARLERARADGADAVASPGDAAEAARAWTGRVGADAVVIAAASAEEGPAALAGDLVRRGGVVVALGDVPLALPRRVYYAKEATVRLATSYGPGRYDRGYEEGGRDYPLPYVRWTAGRNLEAFLALLASRAVRVDDLGERVPFEDAVGAYARLLEGEPAGKAFVFAYSAPDAAAVDGVPARPLRRAPAAPAPHGAMRTALVGAGGFGRGVLWPALARAGLAPALVVASSGPSASEAARRLGFARHGTDADLAVVDPEVDVVVVATPHDSHARLVAAALRAGKHVFCEKPLAIDDEGLADVARALDASSGLLAVGFNRRFSSSAVAARAFLDAVPGPTVVTYRVGAGEPPEGSWIADARVSGGRLVGEACHMVDLAAYLCADRPARVAASGAHGAWGTPSADDAALVVAMAGGSVAAIVYQAVGDASTGKERVEASRGGRTAVIDDFRALTLHRDGEASRRRVASEKGHQAEADAFVAAIRAGGPPPIPYDDLLAVTRATFAARRSLASGRFEDA